MDRIARLGQQLSPRARDARATSSISAAPTPCAATATAAGGVGGNAEPWWATEPGTKRSYSHQLGPDVEAWAPGRALLVLVAQGARPGPTLLVTAGIHGNEYDGMMAIRRVWDELDATSLSGTFVAIVCCNVDAHLVPHRNSATDGMNLARVFPGKPNGTLTERVAYCIQRDFIKRATLMCDLHTAGLDMRMIPIIGYTLNPPPHNPSSLAQQRAAAKAFGLKTIWSNAADAGGPEDTFQPGDEDDIRWDQEVFSKGTSGAGAWLAGVPFLYTEATGSGGMWDRDIKLYAQGVRNLIRHLGISAGPPVPPTEGQVVVEDFDPSGPARGV